MGIQSRDSHNERLHSNLIIILSEAIKALGMIRNNDWPGKGRQKVILSGTVAHQPRYTRSPRSMGWHFPWGFPLRVDACVLISDAKAVVFSGRMTLWERHFIRK
jgi:hypothetical protein